MAEASFINMKFIASLALELYLPIAVTSVVHFSGLPFSDTA